MELSEVWKPVVGWEGLYEVSSLGRVRRVAPGASHRCRVGRVLNYKPNNHGYIQVWLSERGREERHKTHVLVAAAFIGPRPVGADINHKDWNKTNNAASNLEYTSRAENVRHSIHRRKPRRAMCSTT